MLLSVMVEGITTSPDMVFASVALTETSAGDSEVIVKVRLPEVNVSPTAALAARHESMASSMASNGFLIV